MASGTGAETRRSCAPGTLDLGLAADGMTCAPVFVDEHHSSIACIASFADLNGFIVALRRAAAGHGHAGRRHPPTDDDVVAVTDSDGDRPAALNIASSTFRLCADDGRIVGSLVDNGGWHQEMCRQQARAAMHNPRLK